MGPLEEFFQTHEWTQGEFARGPEGLAISPNNQYAVCFCVAGGVERVYQDVNERFSVFRKLLEHCGGQLFEWNDAPGRTKEEVLELVRKAGV